MKPRGDYIDGKFVKRKKSDGELVSPRPADGGASKVSFPTAEVALAEALFAARRAFVAWAAAGSDVRSNALRRLQAQLRNRTDDLIAVLSQETGRPIWDARDEIQTMLAETDGLLRLGAERLLDQLSTPPGSTTRHVPVGVVGLITPFVQPLWLMHADAVAALATGCCVVCKPSWRTPACAQLYAEIIDEADLPAGTFNLVLGDDGVGEHLAASAECDVLLFAGSAQVGLKLRQSACQNPQRGLRTLVSAASTAIVAADADLEQAAYQVALGAALTTGQRCSSTRRVIVEQRVAEPFGNRLREILAGLRVGPPASASSFMGPLIDAASAQRYATLVEELERSARLHLRGTRLAELSSGNYVTPTLFEVSQGFDRTSLSPDALGPLLCFERAENAEHASQLVRRDPCGLALAIFSRTPGQFAELLSSPPAGLLLENAPTTFWPGRIPLRPVGRAGYGGWGIETLAHCTRRVAEVHHAAAFDSTMLPPGMPLPPVASGA